MKKGQQDEGIRKVIGDRFKEAREDARLTREDIAGNCDVSRQMVFKWEKGTSFPEVEHLTMLLQEYGISADWLLGRVEKGGEDTCLASYRMVAPEDRELFLDGVQGLAQGLARRRYGEVQLRRVAEDRSSYRVDSG